jgi:hypothetical protein
MQSVKITPNMLIVILLTIHLITKVVVTGQSFYVLPHLKGYTLLLNGTKHFL